MVRNWELYRVFYHVATASSLTVAAKELHITQPAVSQSMKQLEQQLNVKLFVRQGKGIRLTKEGEILYSHIAKGFDAFGEGEKKLHEILDLNDGEITIGATDYAIKFFLLPHLEQFRGSYPNIRVNLLPMEDAAQGSKQRSAAESPIATAVSKGNVDLGLVENLPDGFESASADGGKLFLEKSKLTAAKLTDIKDIFVAGVGYSYLRSQELPYQLLTHLPLICMPEGSVLRQHLSAHFQTLHLPKMQPAYELERADMIAQFALQNLGVGCVPKDYAIPFIENGSLIECRFSPTLPPRPLFLLQKSGAHISKATEALLNLLGVNR